MPMHLQTLIITSYMYLTNKAEIYKEFNILLENLFSVKKKLLASKNYIFFQIIIARREIWFYRIVFFINNEAFRTTQVFRTLL